MTKAKAIGVCVAIVGGGVGGAYFLSFVLLDDPVYWLLFWGLFITSLLVQYIVWFARKVKRTRAARMRDLQ